ncbi:MAG: hypothetical protein K6A90_11550 [Lachnospiraceae bacterium]|nr:hypothetical protein [Lachnospiraceae bacterium]
MILVKIYVIAFIVVVIVNFINSRSNSWRKKNAVGGYFGPRKVVYSGGGTVRNSAGGSYSGGGGSSYEDPSSSFSAGSEYNMGYDNGGSSAPTSDYTPDQEMAAYQAGYWGAEDFEQTTGMYIDDIMD